MTDWGGGYVTDISYTPGYYLEQNPLHLDLVCLLNGVAGLGITPETRLTYLELGCGQGFNALVLAASNPHWQVIGVDFAPAHIAAARAVAEEAELRNVAFIEADLATLMKGAAGRELPVCDVISLHGLWSWVPQTVRDGIVAVMRERLRPGGIAHLSYNALPAWQTAFAMQRLLREAARASGSSRSDRQARGGLEVVRALVQAEAQHLGLPFVREMLTHLERVPDAYLAHEYMNDSWSPCFHGDVAQALGAAKLSYVGSARLLENFPELTLTDAQRAIAQRFDDPLLRELVKDTCLHRGLRHDVFVRGARRINRAARDEAIGNISVALTRTPETFAYEASVPAGEAALSQEFYRPIVAALADGPWRIRDLMALPAAKGERDNPASLLGLLVGTDQAIPVAGAPGLGAVAERFNAVALRIAEMERIGAGFALATGGALGSPLPCTVLDAHVWAKIRDGLGNAEMIADQLAVGRTSEDRERLGGFVERILAERIPVWRKLNPVMEGRVGRQ